MLIIGELINCTRSKVKEAVLGRDADYIRELAARQEEGGADYIDCNAGTAPEREVEDMRWLVETVQEATRLPLSIDSRNGEALRAGLEAHRNGQPFVNSVTLEKELPGLIFPLVSEHGARVVCLCMQDSGVPYQAAEKVEVARALVGRAEAAGVPLEHLYVDPAVLPVSTVAEAGVACLDALRTIKREMPQVHLTAGLSNISFGLPGRRLLNAAFLAMAMAAGLDSAIADPTDVNTMSALRAAALLLGQDEWGAAYLKAFREGHLGELK
jgi:cobalamin-dependent methionine synthase I